MLGISMALVLILLALGLGILPLEAAEKGTADFYQSAPHEYLGKEIRLRVSSLSPVPELTAADPGYVWMEAATGRPQKEEGKILLRIPKEDSAKLAKTMNLPSSSGRWLEGMFSGHDTGAVLPTVIKQKAPYYIQVSATGAQKEAPEEMETASGSLVVAPKPKDLNKPDTATTPAADFKPATTPVQKQPEGPKAVLFRAKPSEPLQLRIAKSVKMQADFCEIIDQESKLSLVGRPLVAAVLPLPRDGSVPTKEEVEAALRLYAQKTQAIPEASNLLAGPKASWEKFAGSSVASTALPELEDVETAAGIEEPVVEAGYPAWFVWATISGALLVAGLGWIWSRPRSTPA